MDTSEKVNELRIILDDLETEVNDSDTVLLSFLKQAKDVILNRMYPFLDDRAFDELTVPKQYEFLQLRIAAFLLNKRGAEGETQHIENGIHRHYQNADVPEAMLRGILPAVGIPR